MDDNKAEDQSYNYDRLADLLNEAGMLRKTPRSGFAFLGSGGESVAEHSWRTSIIGFILAHLAHQDPARVTFLCMFHDLHEARTGDFNYVNHRYNKADARGAFMDAVKDTGLEQELAALWDEFESRDGMAAKLANDADQLDLICNLQEELSRGNEFAREWLDSALKRLKTPEARRLAEAILKASPHRWWYDYVDKAWWVNRDKS